MSLGILNFSVLQHKVEIGHCQVERHLQTGIKHAKVSTKNTQPKKSDLFLEFLQSINQPWESNVQSVHILAA